MDLTSFGRRSGRTALACALVAAASVAAPASAQTLDELKRPLLEKGEAAIALDVQARGEEIRSVDIFTGSTSYHRPRLALFPQVAYGLSPNLELRIDVVGQVPTTYSHPQLFSWAYNRERYGLLAGEAGIAFRPTSTLELTAGLGLGRARGEGAYAHSVSSDGGYRAKHRTAQWSLGVTWLPGPKTDSLPLRADLDGLHRPLIAARRWRIDGEAQWRSYRQTSADWYDPIPGHVETTIASRDARMRMGAACGLGRGFEARADAYWHPPFTMTGSTTTFCPGCGQSAPVSREESDRYHGVFGTGVRTTWRIGRAEASAAGTWERQQVARELGSGSAADRAFDTSAMRVEGTWLSRPPRRTVDRRGLAGFDRPLVERRQVMLDAGWHHRRHRASQSSFDDTDVAFIWLGATTGVSGSIEVGGHIGRRFARHYLTHGGYERRTTSGGRLTVRPTGRVQLEAAFDFTPRAWMDRFPMVVLGLHDSLRYYETFRADSLAGDRNARVGVRVLW